MSGFCRDATSNYLYYQLICDCFMQRLIDSSLSQWNVKYCEKCWLQFPKCQSESWKCLLSINHRKRKRKAVNPHIKKQMINAITDYQNSWPLILCWLINQLIIAALDCSFVCVCWTSDLSASMNLLLEHFLDYYFHKYGWNT